MKEIILSDFQFIKNKTVIQSEVSQKEKNKYRILTHICGIQKNGIDDLICKTEIETKTQRTNVWTPKGRRGGEMNWEIGIDIYTPLILDWPKTSFGFFLNILWKSPNELFGQPNTMYKIDN